ncbi:hypothetical protein ACSNN7_22475 [Micromonospora sp. URMC 105]|uniref:hypothetical protein n=1 Tax=Micromonospora sp. URMC 105 TaxID=3423413 RepID=UPI003F1CFACE
MTYLLIVLVAVVLCAQFVFAAAMPEPLTTVLRIQAVYWFLGYVFRPMVLVIASPVPVQNDSVADHRLAYGGYETNLHQVLIPILLGQVVFLAAALTLGRRFRSQFQKAEVSPALVLVVFMLLLGARLGWLAGVRSSVVDTLLGLAPIAIGMALVPTHPRRRLVLLVGLLLLTEGAWSVLFASKTPILSLLICLLVLAASRSWRPKPKHLVAAAVAIPVFVLGFSALQSVKQSVDVRSDLQAVDARYPPYVQPAMSIVRRFDLFAAVTDSMYVEGRWMSSGEAVGQAASSFVPRPLNQGKTLSAGERWAVEVRKLSKPSRGGVSLAEGPVAEGNAIAGLPGVAAECFLLAAITVFGARALAMGRTFAFSIACTLIFLPTIQERGLLGIAEVVGKGLQLSLLVGLFSLLLGGVRRLPSVWDGAPVTRESDLFGGRRPSGKDLTDQARLMKTGDDRPVGTAAC